MKKPVRIVGVDDDPSYLKELERVFSAGELHHWVGSFKSPVRFLGEVNTLDVDLVFLDISMPKVSGIECARFLGESLPECRIIMLTVHEDSDQILDAFMNGADGYLLKETGPAEIRDAVIEVFAGGAPMTRSIAKKVIRFLAGARATRSDHGDTNVDQEGWVNPGEGSVEALLTRREYEVLQQLAAGRKYSEIATQLYISHPTVKTHIRHIYEKLAVRNKVEAISKLRRNC